jgi:AraC family transcriptional regulator, transcriptional activator of pobA
LARPSETLYNPRNGDLSLKVTDLDVGPDAEAPTRTNYFTVYWIQAGHGTIWADSASHPFASPSLLFFVPYQYIRFVPESPIRGVSVQFHANFLCVETYHEEVGCNGVLFNDTYGVPVVGLDERHDREVGELIGHIRRELTECGLAHSEILLSYLKVFLIRATRLKREQQGDSCETLGGRLPPELVSLRELIEANYRHLHAPAEYARLLHTDPRSLAKVVKAHLHKTLTELIRERILKHARWDLLHTLKPVKQIAHELGYPDELYFSRLFKRSTGYSPVFFREYETAIRGGRNLSIPLRLPSIPPPPLATENGSEPACES